MEITSCSNCLPVNSTISSTFNRAVIKSLRTDIEHGFVGDFLPQVSISILPSFAMQYLVALCITVRPCSLCNQQTYTNKTCEEQQNCTENEQTVFHRCFNLSSISSFCLHNFQFSCLQQRKTAKRDNNQVESFLSCTEALYRTIVNYPRFQLHRDLVQNMVMSNLNLLS